MILNITDELHRVILKSAMDVLIEHLQGLLTWMVPVDRAASEKQLAAAQELRALLDAPQEDITLWLSGEVLQPGDEKGSWSLGGVFSFEQLALQSCKGPRYFVAPIQLDKVPTEETVVFPGIYFPLSKAAEPISIVAEDPA